LKTNRYFYFFLKILIFKKRERSTQSKNSLSSFSSVNDNIKVTPISLARQTTSAARMDLVAVLSRPFATQRPTAPMAGTKDHFAVNMTTNQYRR
jgi:hypothetical protein